MQQSQDVPETHTTSQPFGIHKSGNLQIKKHRQQLSIDTSFAQYRQQTSMDVEIVTHDDGAKVGSLQDLKTLRIQPGGSGYLVSARQDRQTPTVIRSGPWRAVKDGTKHLWNERSSLDPKSTTAAVFYPSPLNESQETAHDREWRRLTASASTPPPDVLTSNNVTPISMAVSSDIAARTDRKNSSKTVGSATYYTDKGVKVRQSNPYGHDSSKRLTSHSIQGWWNILKSPFLISPTPRIPRFPIDISTEDTTTPLLAGDATHWSCTAQELEYDRTPDQHYGVHSAVFQPRQSLIKAHKLNRSLTAPGKLDPSNRMLNIYRVPSQGEAAIYYDGTRRFGPCSPQRHTERALVNDEGWSPSQSVFREAAQAQFSSSPLENGTPQNRSYRGDQSDDGSNAPIQNSSQSKLFSGACLPGGNNLTTCEMGPGNDDAPLNQHLIGDSIIDELPVVGLITPKTPSGLELPPAKNIDERQSSVIRSHFSLFSAASETEGNAASMRPFTSIVANDDSLQRTSRPLAAATMCSRELPSDGINSAQPKHPAGDVAYHALSSGRLSTQEKSAPIAYNRELEDNNRSCCDMEEGAAAASSPVRFKSMILPFVGSAMALIILLVVLLVVYIPQRRSYGDVEAEWLNLTGFPPMPTGVMTVIQPRLVNEVNGCVQPQNLWTCNMSNPGDFPGQGFSPDFRFEIEFRNATNSDYNSSQLALMTETASSATSTSRSVGKRDAWTDYLFSPSPSPPSDTDQMFLGQTTDHNAVPYDGVPTPFYISLLNSSALGNPTMSRIRRRSDNKWHWPLPSSSPSTSSASSSSAQPSTTVTWTVPPPAIAPNGLPAPAEFYPFVSAQPVRLYNRGQASEHYGFYTYFSRSLYASVSNTTSTLNDSSDNKVETPTITTNIRLEEANAVCTWSETRMLVQVWTQKPGPTPLGNVVAEPKSPNVAAANTTANAMSAPGSFPYSVTVTLDRHGGVAKEKGVYCYALDTEQKILDADKVWVYEDRSYGGTLIDPAPVPGNRSDILRRDMTQGNGIDGGTGGCSCQWQT